jgi:hypothetical protein
MLRPSTKKDAIGRPKQMNHPFHTYLRQSVSISPRRISRLRLVLSQVRVLKFAPSAIMADDWVCQT